MGLGRLRDGFGARVRIRDQVRDSIFQRFMWQKCTQ